MNCSFPNIAPDIPEAAREKYTNMSILDENPWSYGVQQKWKYNKQSKILKNYDVEKKTF